MTTVGLDPGFAIGKGVMLCRRNGGKVIFLRCASEGADLLSRFRDIRYKVSVASAATDRIIIAIEEPTRLLGNQRHVLRLLGMLEDALVGPCEVWRVGTATLKKFATAKGNADKATVATCCTKRWGHLLEQESLNEDEADALVLERIAACLAGEDGFTQAQRECAAKAQRVGLA